MAGMPAENPKTRVPLPPVDAKVTTTACEYCPVACGYKVYTWPVGTEGGPSASENALGTDFPAPLLSGRWPSANMHSTVTIDGILQHVIVLPDPDAEHVNVGGNHSVRGGTLALKLYRPDGPTRDRLQHPLLRVNGTLQTISWDAAIDIIAEMIGHVVENHGELSMGFKHYSYEYFENNYLITKFAYEAIGTPNVAPHHNTGHGTDTPGLDDSGVDAFSASYEDYKEADVAMIIGTDPYETKTVAFTQWLAPGGAKLIQMDPRKTFTAAYAEKNGGVHLQVLPGTDAWAIGAIARYILEQGWEDSEFIENYVVHDRTEIDEDSAWRRRRFGLTYAEWQEGVLNNPELTLEEAAKITTVPVEKLRFAAELLAKPVDGAMPKSMLLYEKGLYWTHNYENTAVLGNLSVLIGARGRPGRATSRMGGHQRGGASGASYPKDKSPTEFEGNKLEMDCDRWTAEGKTRMVWSIGNDWINGSGASQYMASRLREMTREIGPQITSAIPANAIAALKARVDAGGMFIVQSDIYTNGTTEVADLVLPAATWGEEDFARNNAERRLRLYGKFMDAPGEAKPDWWAIAQVAQKMGFEGYDFKDSNELLEAYAPLSGGRKDFKQLGEWTKSKGIKLHDWLREAGTSGIQTPVVIENDEPTGTDRLHTDMSFKGGKSRFVIVDFDAIKERNELLGPNEDEVWVITGRVNHLWQSLYDDLRKPHLIQRYPVAFLEISPQDAGTWGIESGDMVAVESDRVRTQDLQTSFGGFTATAYVTDEVAPGQVFSFFHYPGSPGNSVVTGDAASTPQNPRQPFKFGRGKVTRIGSTNLAETMSFVPRNIV
jgi:arsenite oxidase large subunit